VRTCGTTETKDDIIINGLLQMAILISVAPMLVSHEAKGVSGMGMDREFP